MSHEIQKSDNAVFHRKPAWHGLGIVVENAPTPREALTIAGLEWGVEQRDLFTEVESIGEDGEIKTERVKVNTHVANYRADDKSLLGVVSSNYQPVSNAELADFCEALVIGGEGKVKIESAGSIRGGKKVWFLLKGEAFGIANKDEVFTYLLASNGHDGGTTLRLTPTSIRVVCQNTLHLVIPDLDSGELLSSAWSFKHRSNVHDRLEEARAALERFGKKTEEFTGVANTLAAKGVTSLEAKEFFLECYTADFGEIPANPTNRSEEGARNRAMSAYNSFSKRFDDEKEIAGTSAWNMFNAWSGTIQHDKKARGKDDVKRVESRIDNNLFGLTQTRTQNALLRAFKMASA